MSSIKIKLKMKKLNILNHINNFNQLLKILKQINLIMNTYQIFIPMMILKIIILQSSNPALEQVRQQWLLNI